MRLAFDITSMHDRRTGVGAFTSEILTRLARRDDIDVVGYSVSWRGRDDLHDQLVPKGVTIARRPMAAQPLRQAWRRADWPPIEYWTGAVDVVHGPNFVVPPARRAAQLVTVHDLTFVRYPELCTRDTLQYPALIRRAVRRGAHVHAVSKYVAEEVIDEFHVDPACVHVVANGVDPVHEGNAVAGRSLAGGHRYVLAIGTIEPRKEFPLLVEAFDAVAAHDDDVRLVVAGQDGWGAGAFDAAVQKARHRDRVVRPGFVDDQTRSDLLAGAAVFAYPSRYEGFGLPPLEAMTVGTPVVSTTAGALPEVLGDAALLVAPGDVDAMAGALVQALENETVRTRLIAAGPVRAAGFSWDACADGVVSIYQRLC